MKNILFTLFNSPHFKNKYDVQEKKFLDTDSNYLIVKNIVNNKTGTTISINGKDYFVSDSHLNIPERQDPKEGFLSAYHHSIYLKDINTNEEFVVRFYFDRFDNLCDQPSPVLKSLKPSINDDDIIFVNINKNDLDNIFISFVTSSVDKVKVARSSQNNILKALLVQKNNCENEREATLLKYGFLSQEHVDVLDKLKKILFDIELYETVSLKNRSQNGFIGPDFKSYSSFINSLYTELTGRLKSKKSRANQSTSNSRDEKNYNVVIHEPSLEQKKEMAILELKQNQNVEIEKELKEYQNFIFDLKSTLSEVKRNISKKNIERLLELDTKLLSYMQIHNVNHDELHLLQSETLKFLESFFANLDDGFKLKKQLIFKFQSIFYLIGTQKIFELALRLINIGDDTSLTELFKGFELPVLSEIENLDGMKPNKYALLEWSIVLNQPKCFIALIKAGHKIEYFQSINSPVQTIVGDIINGAPFVEIMINNGLYGGQKKYTEMVSIARKKLIDDGENSENSGLMAIRLNITEKLHQAERRMSQLVKGHSAPGMVNQFISNMHSTSIGILKKIVSCHPSFAEKLLENREILILIEQQYTLILSIYNKMDSKKILNFLKSAKNNLSSVYDNQNHDLIKNFNLDSLINLVLQELRKEVAKLKIMDKYLIIDTFNVGNDGKIYFLGKKAEKTAKLYNKEFAEVEVSNQLSSIHEITNLFDSLIDCCTELLENFKEIIDSKSENNDDNCNEVGNDDDKKIENSTSLKKK